MPITSCPATPRPSPAPEAGHAADWTGRPGAAGRAWPSEHAIGLICRACPQVRRPTETAIDLGCGSGRNSIALAQLGFGRVIAVDVSAALLESARDAAARADVSPETHVAAADDLPFPDQTADLVLCWGLLFALGGAPATRAALGEIARVLRPGGVLVADWRTADDHLRCGEVERVAEDTYRLPPDAPAGLGGVTYSFWTRAQVEALLDETGFAVVAIQRYELTDCRAGHPYSWWQTCARRFAS